ncbi:FAD-dependent oxidoreductase [Mycobacterium montefiorense]|uniref:FAD-dependent oxidoreductase n=1 Tax=Mycobacterium montefiorense TaxID=154654 RepID=UPI0021DE51FB|nr:FAD-dependent oxidoreductase [Mycobacterium montefiorense]MCV7425324.1 FAD-binding protein [Mycobacterium montefiorense]GLE52569.1 oxidoreductase [Mycobacterium montefiorense]
MASWRDKLSELRDALQGPVFTAEDPDYDNEVAVFNMAVRHRPAVAVGAANAADVSEAVRFAGRHDLNIAVLNTGHGPTVSAGEDTLMITTSRMIGLAVDAEKYWARVDSGVRFGELVEVAATYGLAPLPGSSPGVGVVGYTLSGGASSTMGRKYGWAADHVSAIEVVTADGELHCVSAESESDLFSALLGGKSNFGVVVAMEFALFPVTSLYAGALFFSGAHTREVLQAYRELTASAPDELTTSFALVNLPPLPSLPPFMQGQLTVSVRVSYVGDAHVGAQLIDPLRRAAPVLADGVASIPYTQFATISNDPTDPAPAVEHFGLLRELNEDTVKAIVDAVGPGSGSQINIVDIRHLQGAFSKPPPFPNAVGARDAAYGIFGLTVVPPGQEVASYRDSGRELPAALQTWLHDMASPSFVGPADTSEERTRKSYDPTVYEKLRTVKALHDPSNRFRLNHNIRPHFAA